MKRHLTRIAAIVALITIAIPTPATPLYTHAQRHAETCYACIHTVDVIDGLIKEGWEEIGT